jgi:hypothetical protein
MAELTPDETSTSPCCAPETHANCCEPSAKADCCDHSDGCGCLPLAPRPSRPEADARLRPEAR